MRNLPNFLIRKYVKSKFSNLQAPEKISPQTSKMVNFKLLIYSRAPNALLHSLPFSPGHKKRKESKFKCFFPQFSLVASHSIDNLPLRWRSATGAEPSNILNLAEISPSLTPGSERYRCAMMIRRFSHFYGSSWISLVSARWMKSHWNLPSISLLLHVAFSPDAMISSRAFPARWWRRRECGKHKQSS